MCWEKHLKSLKADRACQKLGFEQPTMPDLQLFSLLSADLQSCSQSQYSSYRPQQLNRGAPLFQNTAAISPKRPWSGMTFVILHDASLYNLFCLSLPLRTFAWIKLQGCLSALLRRQKAEIDVKLRCYVLQSWVWNQDKHTHIMYSKT